MDKKRDVKEKEGREILKEFRTGIRRRKGRGAFLFDAAMLLVAFVFSRCHIAYGSYPLGVILTACATHRVIIIAIGAALGSLTLGSIGYVYAILVPLTVCLRVLLGGADVPTFSESYVTRVASSAISASLGGLYEILTRGVSVSSVIFTSVSVLLSVGISISLFGVFRTDIGIRELVFSPHPHILRRDRLFESGGGATFFLSSLIFVFLISFSLNKYSFFGITLSLCFATLITLISSARFGAVVAMAVGFVSGLASGASSAVSFALAGGVSGFLFVVGVGYAIVGGGIALALWASFVGGISGLLSHLPEYGATALVILPLIKSISHAEDIEEEKTESPVGRMLESAALLTEKSPSDVEGALYNLAGAFRTYSEGESRLEFEEYRNIVIAVTAGLGATPCEEKVDALAGKLYKGDRPEREYLERLFGKEGGSIYDGLVNAVANAERECYVSRCAESVIGEYEHIGKMLMHERFLREENLERDTEMSEKLSAELRSLGFADGEATVLGRRKRCIIAAARDLDNKTIAAPAVKGAFEKCIGSSLCEFEYYKKENTSLMKCYTAPLYEIEYASVLEASVRTGVSGDTSLGFESDGKFYSLISDGMGSGEGAKRTSKFVVDYLKGAVIPNTPSVREAVGSVSSLLQRGREECAATVDAFSFDLYTGESRFFKCGAVSSFIKRENSIFSVRCSTAPIGLLRGVDADEMMAEVRVGDIVIMISDGVSAVPDESAWLLEFLSLPTKLSAEEYARDIIALSREHGDGFDDMTVSVMYVHDRIPHPANV